MAMDLDEILVKNCPRKENGFLVVKQISGWIGNDSEKGTISVFLLVILNILNRLLDKIININRGIGRGLCFSSTFQFKPV